MLLCICPAAAAQVLLLHHQEQTRLANKRAEERHAACLNSSSNTSRCAAPESSHARLADFGAALEDDSVLQQLSLVGEQGVAALPDNCRALCQARSSQEEAAVQLRLHQALPLLPLDVKASRRIRWVLTWGCVGGVDRIALRLCRQQCWSWLMGCRLLPCTANCVC
jgi:hypothetical protein